MPFEVVMKTLSACFIYIGAVDDDEILTPSSMILIFEVLVLSIMTVPSESEPERI